MSDASSRSQPATTPRRIVSLVPSITETVAWLGWLDRLVGRTRYCIEPAGAIEAVEAVGGTKNPDVERIVALRPDVVIVNEEENRLEDARALERAGVAVHVTHPRTVAEAAAMIEELGTLVGAADRAHALAADIRSALAHAAEQTAAHRPRRVFCPIWRNPWMTFGDRTYVGNVLASVGLTNVFGDGSADFFEVKLDEVVARSPDLVVLPDEPYVFGPKHANELRACGLKSEIHYIDGKDLSWYGPRVPRALERLLTITSAISHA